ncbi:MULTISPECIES: type III secretion system chaperone [unclassified Pseudovibrio]|uniref:type III secretion system chaperone n=1 Tax=unclassified Pseudovibrio TaxID=2627060 RepID=UPI0007AED80C|nr:MULTISPECIES: type III secretion system chaperone [unclassified Pseudovibrio]KZL22279.1 Tir chaperone protein (CesT) [Pseudovibrio sp. WM33]KZL27703.1 Tir chaperone protein (CesT) [Pseudovibrio sp. Ad37]
MHQLLDELFNEIGRRIGLDGLSLNEDNTLLLGLEHELFMNVQWRDSTQTLLFNAVLCTQPCSDLEKLQALMQTNCVLTHGHGMSFNLDPATDHINLSQVVSIADKSSFTLQEKLDLFISTSAAWHERLNSTAPLQMDWQHSTPVIAEPSFETLGMRV